MTQPNSPRFLDITPNQAKWWDHANTNFTRAEETLKAPLPIAYYLSTAELPDASDWKGCLAIALVSAIPQLFISNGTDWFNVQIHRQRIVASHVTGSGANPGASVGWATGRWGTRTLNSMLRDETGEATISSNQITVPAGTYDVLAEALMFDSGAHMLALYDVTNDDYILFGTSAKSQTVSGGTTSESTLAGRVSFAAATTLELRYACEQSKATNGLGGDSMAGSESVTSAFLRMERISPGQAEGGESPSLSLLDLSSGTAGYDAYIHTNFQRVRSYLRSPLPIAWFETLPSAADWQYCLAAMQDATLNRPFLYVSDGTSWINLSVPDDYQHAIFEAGSERLGGAEYAEFKLNEIGASFDSGITPGTSLTLDLPAGSYRCRISCAMDIGMGRNKLVVANTAGTVTHVHGLSTRNGANTTGVFPGYGTAFLSGSFTLASPASVVIAHYRDTPGGTKPILTTDGIHPFPFLSGDTTTKPDKLPKIVAEFWRGL